MEWKFARLTQLREGEEREKKWNLMAPPKRAAATATIFQSHTLFVPRAGPTDEYEYTGKFHHVSRNQISQSTELWQLSADLNTFSKMVW